MKYLLDASSIYKIVKINKLDIIENSTTLDLAKYELGNTVLKDCMIHKHIDATKAQQLVNFFYTLLDTIDTVRVVYGKDVLKTALDLKLSFYDAAYVQHSKTANLIFVTEDGKLEKKVRNHIKVSNVEELLKHSV